MHELVAKVLYATWGIWRFRWTAIGVAWLIAGVGWMVVHQVPHKFYASARVYIDTNQVLEPLLVGLAIQPDVKQRAALIGNTLLSRPNLEKLVDDTDLGSSALDGDTPLTQADKEKLTNDMVRNLAIRDSSGSSSVYTLSYTHADPEIAKQVVDALIGIFVQSNQSEEEADNEATRTFLDRRIAEYESRLAAAENRLADFKRENAGSMPGESGGYYQRIDTAESALQNAALSLRELENRRDDLNRQLASEQPAIINRDPNYTPTDVARIQKLQDELDSLLVKFTDRHPRVAQLKQVIADLERTRLEQAQADELAGNDRSTGGVRRLPSVINQQLKSMVSETEASIAELQVRVSYYRGQLEELNATVDSIPLVEEKLVQLNRDYKTIQSQYEILLGRRETARLTEEVKKSSENVKFRVVDPAYVDSRPAVPNKKLLNTIVFTAASAAGVGLSLLLSLLMPVFFDKRSLVDNTHMPVIGSVTCKRSRLARTATLISNLLFALLTCLLVCTLGVLLVLEMRNMQLMDLLTSRDIPLLSVLVQSDAYQRMLDSTFIATLATIVERIL